MGLATAPTRGRPFPYITGRAKGCGPGCRECVVSVLLGSTSDQAGFRGKGPAVGLFAGQQIRYLAGPLFVDHPYELAREIVALSESARTESVWIKTTVFDGVDRRPVAEMILNSATLKASYARYDEEARALGLAS